MRAFRFLVTVLAFWVAARSLWSFGPADGVDTVAAAEPEPAREPLIPIRQVTQADSEVVALVSLRKMTFRSPDPSRQVRVQQRDVRIAKTLNPVGPASQSASTVGTSAIVVKNLEPLVTTSDRRDEDVRSPSKRPGRTQARKPALEGWLLLRPKSQARSLLSGGQLGSSQFGLRATGPVIATSGSWTLRPFGRLTSAFYSPRQEEGTLGVAARASGTRTSLETSVERRFGLGPGGRNAFAAYVAAGGNRSLEGAKLDIAAYAQAGVVGLRNRDAFADGSATIYRRVLSERHWRAKLGTGIWAGAQPGVARFDVGPSVLAEFSIGEIPVRAQVDWRFRVAGRAAPASGPALTIAFAN
jgi:hypothetical protein